MLNEVKKKRSNLTTSDAVVVAATDINYIEKSLHFIYRIQYSVIIAASLKSITLSTEEKRANTDCGI